MNFVFLLYIFSFFLMNLNIVYSQTESISEKKEQYQYYKMYKEHFYKEDEPIQIVEDLSSETSFYLVKRNNKNKIVNVGFYVRELDEYNKSRIVLTENINSKNIAFYYINYKYDKEDRLILKEYKNKYDKVISYNRYIWQSNKGNLQRVEMWGETDFLGKMELKSFSKYKWEGDQLRVFTSFNQDLKPLEKYYFVSNPDSGENKDPAYLVGNNKISMFVLEKYERFVSRSKTSKRSFYVVYQKFEGAIIRKLYNNDEVLMQEYPPVTISSDNDVSNLSLIE